MRMYFRFLVVLLILLMSNATYANNFIIHKVKQGETMYSIAKMYNVPIDVIYKNNPSLSSDILKIDTELRIPKKLNNTINVKQNSTQNTAPKYDTILHKVKPKETMYAISKFYKVSIDDIKKWNNLQTTDLSMDALIKIVLSKNTINNINSTNLTAFLNNQETNKILGNKNDTSLKPEKIITTTEYQNPTPPIKTQVETKIQPTTTKPDIAPPSTTNTVNTTISTNTLDTSNSNQLAKIPLTLAEQFSIQNKNNKTTKIKATGAPMNTSDLSINNTFFALHKTAKIGSIIKVKNLENNKVSYAKVIGKLPDIDENKNIVVRLSLGVRKTINMGNGKAYLEMDFIE